MIHIPRSLAHDIRAVFRRIARKASSSGPVVVFDGGPDGLRVRLHNAEVSAEYHETGAVSRDSLAIPLEALADFEGRKPEMVTLERTASGGVQATWQDGVVPQAREYPAPEKKLSAIPDAPREMTTNEPGFMKALSDAARSASHDNVRYALDHIQLRGKTGEIVATDGHQLLVQAGFQFGWDDDVLIPGLSVFGLKELPQQEAVTIGKSATHVTITADRWTLHMPINKEGRFPATEGVVPSVTKAVSRANIDVADGEFLARALASLPGKGEDNAPVTLDLNGQVVVRGKASDDGRVAELTLVRSAATGKAVRISLNRELFARALDLGFSEVCVVGPDKPFLFRDERRTLVVMPLDKNAIVGPSDKAICIASANGEEQTSRKVHQPEAVVLEAEAMSITNGTPSVNGTKKASRTVTKATTRKAPSGTLAGLVTEAEALKDVMRQLYTRTHQLLAGLKKYRRQNRVVQSTLASLRQLKSIAG